MAIASSALSTLVILAMGHFVGDFVLQNDRMAVEKCPGDDATLPWYWWLTAHSACHGLLTAAITGSAWIGCAEWGAHWMIDYYKCCRRFDLTVDQLLHLLCKGLWVVLLLKV